MNPQAKILHPLWKINIPKMSRLMKVLIKQHNVVCFGQNILGALQYGKYVENNSRKMFAT